MIKYDDDTKAETITGLIDYLNIHQIILYLILNWSVETEKHAIS